MSSKHILTHKDEYFIILESFLNKEIDGEKFRSLWYSQRHKDLQDDRKETKIIDDKPISGEITWEEYEEILINDYGFPQFDHPFTDLVDAVYSELKRFCQPSDMDAFEPGVDIDEDELRKRVKSLLEEYYKKDNMK